MEELVFTPDAGAKLRATSERDVPQQVLDELLAAYAGRCPTTIRLASTLTVVKAQMIGASAASAPETFAVELLPRVLLNCAVTYIADIDAVVPVWDCGGVRRDEPLTWEPPAPWRLFAVSCNKEVHLMLVSWHPDGVLRLRRPPFANVYDDGRVCNGSEVAAVPENPVYDASVLEHHAQAVYSLMVNAYNSDLASAATRCGHVCRWDAAMEQKTDDHTNEDVASLIESCAVLAPNFPDAVFFAVGEILRNMHGMQLAEYWTMSLPGLLKNGGPVLASMRRDARRFVTGETDAEEPIARNGPEEDDAAPEPEEDDENEVPEETTNPRGIELQAGVYYEGYGASSRHTTGDTNNE